MKKLKKRFVIRDDIYNLKYRLRFSSNSIVGSHEGLGDVDDVLLAVSGVLISSITHLGGLIPNSNEEGLSGFSDASSTTSLSGEDGVFNSIFFSSSDVHVLLVANSESTLLTSLSLSGTSLHEGGVLIASDLLFSSILGGNLNFVSSKLESLGGGPHVSVMSINASEVANVGNLPVVGFRVEGVLDLVHVSIPRHL